MTLDFILNLERQNNFNKSLYSKLDLGYQFLNNLSIINLDILLKKEDVALHLINKIFWELRFLSNHYPHFDSWIEEQVFNGLYNDTRSIIIEWRKERIAGLAILKHDSEEKKLCCLRVMPEFQNKGIGIILFKKSFEVLQTDKPLLTINDEKIFQFERIFEFFKFEKTMVYPNLYRLGSSEISYNGYLK